jgi:hypothetical protein
MLLAIPAPPFRMKAARQRLPPGPTGSITFYAVRRESQGGEKTIFPPDPKLMIAPGIRPPLLPSDTEEVLSPIPPGGDY